MLLKRSWTGYGTLLLISFTLVMRRDAGLMINHKELESVFFALGTMEDGR